MTGLARIAGRVLCKRGHSMPAYRCYFRDGDNKVFRMHRADHPSDAEAVVWGADLLQQHPNVLGCEVWQGERLVYRLEQETT